MSQRFRLFLALASSVLLVLLGTDLPGPPRAQAAEADVQTGFALVEGDRVVLLGSTFIERDQAHGYLEAALTARLNPRHVQFRNLGWSGDNVFGEARAGFGSVADGFEQLKTHVLALKPTVILLAYGANESFAGRAGLPSFLVGLETLLSELDETAARIVFILPPPQENLGPPLPDPAAHNQDLKLYGEAITAVAAKRRAPVVNLFDLLGKRLQPPPTVPLTDNGLHLTGYGYWRAAPVIEQALGLPARRWQIEIDAKSRNIAARGAAISAARFAADRIKFSALDEQLPLPPAPPGAAVESAGGVRIVRVFNLPAGKYALRIGGAVVGEATFAQWAAGVPITRGPDFEQVEQLRRAILVKNLLYFHRWRPQNETYLFGFRKHEQGQNAIEIPQFDPLVAAKEAEIHALAAPLKREYELVSVEAK